MYIMYLQYLYVSNYREIVLDLFASFCIKMYVGTIPTFIMDGKHYTLSSQSPWEVVRAGRYN